MRASPAPKPPPETFTTVAASSKSAGYDPVKQFVPVASIEQVGFAFPNEETAFRAQVTISMSVQSYREGRVLYWDDKAMKVVAKPPKALA